MREWLKDLRNEKGLSQSEIAMELGMGQSYYAMIENGERQKDMSVSMAEKLAGVLDVPLTVILDNEKRD